MESKYAPKQTDWMETVSGRKFPFLNPAMEDIDIKDIAYSLANTCRFNGHVAFFSVAEHSVAVAARLPSHLQLAGLLHDAAEAYVPLKKYLPDYKAIEDKIQGVINTKYGVDTYDMEITDADKKATSNEAYYLLKSRGRDWISVLHQPEPKFQPRCLPPLESYKLFMTWFKGLSEKYDRNVIELLP